MSGHAPQSYTIAKVGDLQEGRSKVVMAGTTPVALVLSGGKYRALGNVCRHRGGPVGEGDVDPAENIIACPWHGWEYNLDTGKATLNPLAQLPVYPVEVVGDEIRVRL